MIFKYSNLAKLLIQLFKLLIKKIYNFFKLININLILNYQFYSLMSLYHSANFLMNLNFLLLKTTDFHELNSYQLLRQ